MSTIDVTSVAEQTEYGEQGMAVGTVFLFLIILVGYAGVFYGVYLGELTSLSASVSASILAYMSFTVVHEAGHGNISLGNKYAKPIERVIGHVASLPFLILPFAMFARIHDLHHAYTNQKTKDPDSWVHSQRFVGVLLKSATLPFYYFYVAIVMHKDDEGIKAIRLSSSLYVLTSVILMSWAVWQGFGHTLLFLGIIPFIVSSVLLAVLFDWLPHVPHEKTGRMENTRIVLFPFAGILTLGQNYHLIHHLYPRLPWYEYGRVFREKRHILQQQGGQIDHLPTIFKQRFKQGQDKSVEAHSGSSIADNSTVSTAKEHAYQAKLKTLQGKYVQFPVSDQQYVLESAIAQKVRMRHACKAGHCGSCKVKIVSGEVSQLPPHATGILPKEKAMGMTLACQCIPMSDIEIEMLP